MFWNPCRKRLYSRDIVGSLMYKDESVARMIISDLALEEEEEMWFNVTIDAARWKVFLWVVVDIIRGITMEGLVEFFMEVDARLLLVYYDNGHAAGPKARVVCGGLKLEFDPSSTKSAGLLGKSRSCHRNMGDAAIWVHLRNFRLLPTTLLFSPLFWFRIAMLRIVLWFIELVIHFYLLHKRVKFELSCH
ncbi:hypothetical protein Ancab_011313 [Ancistrocladus abbreviatus]